MHAKVVTIDVGSDGHAFKNVDKHLVNFLLLELLQNLVAESEMLSHGTALVVAAEHDHLLGEVQLESE